jgi:7-cyano-7-deazaguanine reductase
LKLTTLGTSRAKFSGLETFPSPAGISEVTLISDECVAVCPVTGQPDWYTVEATYHPTGRCVESKTFKLYIQSFKEQGTFCEPFACIVADELGRALEADVRVKISQKPRGGVRIVATAEHLSSTGAMK